MTQMSMAWLYLIIAGISEVGWPLGFKLASIADNRMNSVSWIIFSIFSMAISGLFLYLAQKTIPIGTAYIVWTGLGGVCTFLIGVFFFQDPSNLMRFFGAFLILSGVLLLNLA